MDSNRRHQRMSVLLVAVISIAALWIRQSESQDARRVSDASEVGRYQMIETQAGTRVFDTKTARSWVEERWIDGNTGAREEYWTEKPAPWLNVRKPQPASKKPQPASNLMPEGSFRPVDGGGRPES